MEDTQMSEELESQIFGLRRKSSAGLRGEDFNGIIHFSNEAWKLIPEPKLKFGESFLVARMMCEAAIGLGNSELGQEWLVKYQKADLERLDSGERDLMAGRMAYMNEEFEKAKEFFAVADKKSDGRLFKDPSYAHYYMFYKKK